MRNKIRKKRHCKPDSAFIPFLFSGPPLSPSKRAPALNTPGPTGGINSPQKLPTSPAPRQPVPVKRPRKPRKPKLPPPTAAPLAESPRTTTAPPPPSHFSGGSSGGNNPVPLGLLSISAPLPQAALIQAPGSPPMLPLRGVPPSNPTAVSPSSIGNTGVATLPVAPLPHPTPNWSAGAYIHAYRVPVHVVLSPVLHVEGCRTLLGSVVVHYQLSGLYVFVAFHLSILLYAFSILCLPLMR
jgi:hypothetical protein